MRTRCWGGSGRAIRAKKEQQYTTTIHAIASALKKVSRVTPIPKGGKVYRGMSGVRLPDAFEKPDEYGCRGGVELGFMSTSTSKVQALGYIDMSKSRCGLSSLPPPSLSLLESLPASVAAAWQSVRVEQ